MTASSASPAAATPSFLHSPSALRRIPTFAAPAAAAKAAAHAIALEVTQDRLVVSAPLDDATIEQLIDLLPPTLRHLEMPRANMTVVPESVGKFTALRTLSLTGCEKLAALPESVGELTALHTLDLSGCKKLWTLPKSVGNLGALQTLDLSRCLLNTLPASISQLTQLDEASCEQVEAMLRRALTALPSALPSLVACVV